MRPVDPELLAGLPILRRYLALLTGVGVLIATAILVQAELLADLLGAGAGVAPLLAAFAARGVLSLGQSALAGRCAARIKTVLREQIIADLFVHNRPAGERATLATRGVDAVDGYLTGYLPTLVTAVIVPVAVLIRLFTADVGSALIIVATLPLIPVFAILVGAHTRARTARQWRLLSTLGGHFLDVVTGLTTLKVFGRARSQVKVVRAMSDAHADATLRTLRVAFLSALVLELVATLSIALVAVPVGFRLLDGSMTVHTALLVLLLAPEAYLPLRAAGAKFHASAEGLAVFEQVRTRPAPAQATKRPPDVRTAAIRLENVTVRYGERAALSEVDLYIDPGERLALIGPSGAGKSTLLAVLLGFVEPDEGRVLVDDTDLRELDLPAWRAQLAWVPQQPTLFAGTIAENIRLGDDTGLTEAARAAELEPVLAQLPQGYETALGERGFGLSSGQRQRIGLARALLRRDAGLLLLDEPTARLDQETEAAVVTAARRLLSGRTAVLVAHRPAMLGLADRVVELRNGTLHLPVGRAA
jgi:ATP-binding cassette subfamily C protein CydD